MKDISEILGALDPKTRKRVLEASAVKIEKLPTPSISLTAALRGGFAFGRQILLWGNKSAGKTAFALQMIAIAQKAGKTCAFLDAEETFDPEWATRLGVDVDQLIVADTRTINQMVDVGTDLMAAGVDLIVVDSISALLPAIYFEKDSEELKQLQDTKQIGAEAKDMTHAVKMLNFANQNTMLVLISQQRNSFGSMHATHIPTGGMAVKFFSTTIVKLWSSESDKNCIYDDVTLGDRVVKRRVGRGVDWTVDYNKTGPQFVGGSYDFYFDGDHVGIDTLADLVDTCEEYGVIEKSGTWYVVGDEKMQGKTKVIKHLRENPDLIEEYRKTLYEKI